MTQEEMQLVQPDGSIKIKIVDYPHQLAYGAFVGLNELLADMRKRADRFGKLAGYSAAEALVERHIATVRLEAYQRNVTLAAKAGIDLNAHEPTMIDSGFLVCTPRNDEEG